MPAPRGFVSEPSSKSSSNAPVLDDELQIGEVLGVHGVKGALKVRIHSVASTALEIGRKVRIAHEGKTLLAAEITRVSAKPGTDQVRLWLEELSTRDAAEALRGAELWMNRDELGPLTEDEYYLADLVGLSLRVRNAPDICLGRVVGVVDNRMQDLLEIEWTRASGKASRWLLPAVGAYLEEISDEILWIDPPEGLMPAELGRLIGESPT